MTLNQAALLEEVKPFALLASIEVWWEGDVMWFRKAANPGPNVIECQQNPNLATAMMIIRILHANQARTD